MTIDISVHVEPDRASREMLDCLELFSRILRKVDHMAHTLDEMRDNQAKLKALVERLIVLVQVPPAGTFTPAQQAEIDEIVASQEATLAEEPPVV